MLLIKNYIVYITAACFFLLVLFLNQPVLALDLPEIPTMPQWKPADVNIQIPTLPPLPTLPPMPTLGWHCDCTPTPTPPGNPTPTPTNKPTVTPTTPPGGGGGGGGGTSGGGGGGGGAPSGGGGGEVLGATTFAPTGTFQDSLIYLSVMLGLFFMAKSVITRYGKKYTPLLHQ